MVEVFIEKPQYRRIYPTILNTSICNAKEGITNHERSKDCNVLIVRLLNNQNAKNGVVKDAVFARYTMCICIYPSDTAA